MVPALATERLQLLPRTLADTDAWLAMDRMPGVLTYIPGPWHDPDAHRRFIEARTLGPYAEGLGYWIIRERADDTFLGGLLLIPSDGLGPEIEIGWRLRPEAHGRGVATEAALALVRHAFDTVGLITIIAEIDPRNAASINVARKIGMRFEGEAGSMSRFVLNRGGAENRLSQP